MSLKQKTVCRDNHRQNIWDQLQLSCKIVHYGKSVNFIFLKLFATTDKISVSR